MVFYGCVSRILWGVLGTEPIYHKYTIAMEETCVKIQTRDGQNLWTLTLELEKKDLNNFTIGMDDIQ